MSLNVDGCFAPGSRIKQLRLKPAEEALAGSIEIDYKIVLRQIRPIALVKKNWLFVGSDAGGKRDASIYSLMNTANMHGLNPQHY